MADKDFANIIDIGLGLEEREGGSLDFEGGIDTTKYINWVRSSTIPKDFLPFIISIYDTEKNEDALSLTMMINPRDLNIGQAQVVNTAYSRIGWISTLWGNQQATITASGLSAGFYYVTDAFEGGITNFSRKNSEAFFNLISIISLFKNNGYYFMDAQEIPSLFRRGSRVINVMDTIKVTYDGSEYLGSFNSFSLNDVATNPYRLDYSFEFTVSSFGTDTNSIEGHVKKNKNDKSNTVITAIQGRNTDFLSTVQMNSAELNRYFPPDPMPKLDEYLRGGAESAYRNENRARVYKKVDIEKFLKDHPSIDAKLVEVANKLGLTKYQLGALINFESAGSWDPTVTNPYSSAIGIGQWTNIATEAMSTILMKSPYNLNSSDVSSSENLMAKMDTVEKQLDLFYVYCQSTRVGPKGSTTTLLKAMSNCATPDERLQTLMIGHFLPSAVGLPLDTQLPPKITSVNPGINTPRDYIVKAYSGIKESLLETGKLDSPNT